MLRRMAIIASVLVLVGYLLTGVTEVRPGEIAVVRRFGRVLDVRPEPGLWVGLPWGMDRLDRVALDQVRRVEVGYRPEADDGGTAAPAGQLLTGDHNLVNVQAALSYAVRREEAVAFVVHAGRADGLVAAAAEAALAEWVAGRGVDDVLLRGKVELAPWLVAETRRRLESYEIGVDVREATVALLLPPAEVKGDFDRVTQAQTEIRTRRHRAEEEAERGLAAARGEAYRLGQMAAAHALDQRLRARAEADSFETRRLQYARARRDNPDALAAIWWDEMGKLFAKLREGGRVDLLDNRLGADGLDITIVTPPKKK